MKKLFIEKTFLSATRSPPRNLFANRKQLVLMDLTPEKLRNGFSLIEFEDDQNVKEAIKSPNPATRGVQVIDKASDAGREVANT